MVAVEGDQVIERVLVTDLHTALLLLAGRTPQLTCPAGAGADELQKAYMPAGSGAAFGSALRPHAEKH
jgi:hypothetical protein